MAKGKGCKIAPEINGELSTLYLDLFKLILQRVGKDKAQLARLITNVLYVHYESNSQLKDSLDNMNKQRNKQGQHEAADVFQALNGNELITYSDFNALDTLSISEGIKIDTVAYSTFTSWQQAYQKALDINTNHPNLSAYVIYKGGNYQVKVNNKTTINMIDRVNTEIETKLMELIDNALASINVSLDSISFEADTYFGKKFENLVRWLRNTPLTDPKYLLKKDLKMLVSLFQNETIVDRLITKFGGIDAVVDTYYDWYRNNYTATPSTQTQLLAAMDLMHTFKGLDTDTLYNISKTLTDNIKQNSSDYNAYKLFDLLNLKYKLALAAIQISKKNLDSLTKLLEYTIGSLGHQAKAMRASGDRTSSAEFMDRVRELNQDLENKEYTQSLANFLSTMSVRLDEILNNLTSVIPQGADINFILERGTWYRRAEQYLEVYEPVVENIMRLQNLDRDILISDADVAALLQAASNLFETIVGMKQAMARGKDAWAKQAISLMMAENSDLTLDLIMETISQDASWLDRLWNPATISNIPAAVLVNYIQSARRIRTQKMAEIAQRITKIANLTNRNTRFMYERVKSPYGDTYYITSEYDWEGFNKAKGKKEASLKKRGIIGGAFDIAMERWMLANTEEVEVDHTNGRTERVPKLKKAVNPLDSLTYAQRQAYDEFLQLKAEIESLLPEFALNLYRPPQLRKSAIDQLTSTKNPLTNLWRAGKEAYQSSLGVREDEVGMGQVIDADTGEIVIPHTNMVGSTDTVPINYILMIKELGDLLLNFAEGISHLAESAINYDSMSEIMDTVEILSDYINDKVSPMQNGALMAKGFFYGAKTFWERITNTEGSNVNTILQDQKQRMLYNNNTAGRSIKATKRLAFLRRVTSINALTFNVFGALNNLNEAHRKVFEEALVKNGTFGLDDLVYAYVKIGWGHIAKFPKHMVDFFTGRKECVESLLMERFDVTKDKFKGIANKKYRTNFFRKAISTDYSMIMYSIGETRGRMLIAYSTLHSIKAIVNGKKTHLTKAFESVLNPDGTYSLKVKQGATLENGEPITEEYLDQVAKNMNATAEATLGGMSDEALGLLGTTALGMLTLHLRRWMVGVMSEYFRGTHYNAATGKLKTGAWKGIYDVSVAPILKAFADADGNLPWSKNWAKDMKTFTQDVALNYKNLRPDLKVGASRFIVATGMMTLLSILSDALLKSLYPKHHDEEWFKVVFYLLMRQKMDVAPTAPDLNHMERIGLVGSSIIEIMDKPYASASTVKDYIGLVRELDKMGEPIERGPHEGEDRYWRHVRKTLWKPGELWNRIEGLSDTDELISSLGGMSSKYSAKKEYERLTGEEIKDKKSSKGKGIGSKKSHKKKKNKIGR